MAVYKPTFCSPFSDGVDARIGYRDDMSATLIKFLSCNIDTSNKNITGYKIRVLDSSNNQVFPVSGSGRISPVEELQREDYGYIKNDTNSGLNGTVLQIPFFQNYINIDRNASYNNIYYSDKFLADHIILADNLGYSPRVLTNMERAKNWNYSASNDTLTYNWTDATLNDKTKNAITLDGDRLLLGEIVLVAIGAGAEDQTYKAGLWKATLVNDNVVLVRWQTVMGTQTLNDRVTITQGETFHNTSWRCKGTASSDSFGVFEYIPNGGVWYNSEGETIPNFNCNDEIFKWEITLYQGNNIVYDSEYGQYALYNNVSPEWLDMTLTSGKIMGTTSERIQLGGIPYTTSTLGTKTFNYAEGIIPQGTDADPLILQGTYIELSSRDFPKSIISGGTRVYVKTYDATYGHVYPLTDNLDSTVANNATYCQFFKYSSNPDDILDTDIINYTFNSNVAIKFYQVSNNTWTEKTEEELSAVSVLERKLVISTESGQFSTLESGDLILLANQTLPKQNGVYTYSYTYSADGTTKYHCIERAAGYTTWANYIGKVIYTINGSSISRCNLESLAMAGAYTLWNPLSTTSGGSALYFTQERPILLFRNRLKTNRTFNLFDTLNDHPNSNTKVAQTAIDGITINVGDMIIYKDGKFGTVTETDSTGYQIGSVISSVLLDDYFYILNGKTMGKLVFKWANKDSWNSDDASWDLHTATILHNTTTRTFISPWTGLQKEMKICLLNNKFIRLADDPLEDTKWIDIDSFNDKLFFIEHPEIAQPLSSEDNTDSSVPYLYDIRYYFRASDENPFYSYETPYIRLYKNGELYSDLSKSGSLSTFMVQPRIGSSSTSQTLEYFKVLYARRAPLDSVGNTNNNKIYNVSYFVSQAQITGRSVNLAADYIQFGITSWKSYEWILYNEKGEVIQDTGKRYDKTISVTFYGLANDGTTSINYVAELLIENSFGDTLKYTLILVIVPGEVSQFIKYGNFSAIMDCDTQSVLLTIDGLSQEESYSIYRREYEVYLQPGPRLYGYYCPTNSVYIQSHWGKFYTDTDFIFEISPKNKNYLYEDKQTGYLYKYNGADAYPQFSLIDSYKIFKKEWEPVLLKNKKTTFRDFNISNHRSYQYIIYPGEAQIMQYGLDSIKQTFANYDGQIWQVDDTVTNQGKVVTGSISTSAINGEPILTNWNCWSIIELIPQDQDLDAPIVKQTYKADMNNLWLFKYSLETGSQTQNFNKEEIQTLGQYPKMGYGNFNTQSGSVSALLGSEIILGSQLKYRERLREGRITPLSSNESAKMLSQWRDFCFSKNPKLLRDMKGQSWIVQIISSNNTPQNFVKGIPDTISFDWKQIGSTDHVIIYSDIDDTDQQIIDAYGDIEWKPLYKK